MSILIKFFISDLNIVYLRIIRMSSVRIFTENFNHLPPSVTRFIGTFIDYYNYRIYDYAHNLHEKRYSQVERRRLTCLHYEEKFYYKQKE